MKVVFLAADKPRERILADAFGEGVKKAGDDFSIVQLGPDEDTVVNADVVCMVGVKSKRRFEAFHGAGTHVVYLDKGYVRGGDGGPIKQWEYWRVAMDDHQPTRMLENAELPPSRMDELGLMVSAWRKSGTFVLIAGSSAKYHEFYGLRHPTEWTQRLVKSIQKFTAMPIVYRPKPSWKEAVPVDGTTWSGRDRNIMQALEGAHALITHGSNAVFEAVQAGIPTVTLGPAVSQWISSRSVDQIASPYLATYQARYQWLANLCWWQWTMQEMAEGKAWEFLKPRVYGR